MEDLFKNVENSRVVVDGIEVPTKKYELEGICSMRLEIGTNGFQGGDSGHGCRVFFRLEDTGSSDIRALEFDGDSFSETYDNEVGFTIGGDAELEEFIEALGLAYETLKDMAYGTPKVLEPVNEKLEAFRDYLSELVRLYRETGKLKGMSAIGYKYHISKITKEQFFASGLQKAAANGINRLGETFCRKMYAYVLGKGEMPMYN